MGSSKENNNMNILRILIKIIKGKKERSRRTHLRKIILSQGDG